MASDTGTRNSTTARRTKKISDQPYSAIIGRFRGLTIAATLIMASARTPRPAAPRAAGAHSAPDRRGPR